MRNLTRVTRVVSVVRVLLLVLLVAVLAACNGGGSSEAAVVPPEVQRCLGAEVNENRDHAFEGLSEANARARAAADGLTVRIVGRGDDCHPRHSDYVVRRVNIYLDDAGSVLWAGHF